MGQIQNAINQIFTSTMGATLTAMHSPYVKERKATATIRKEQAGREERIKQLQGSLKEVRGNPDISVPLPVGAKETQYEELTPKREQALEERIKEHNANPGEDFDARIKGEVKKGTKLADPYLEELEDLYKGYNVASARLGSTERKDLGDIPRQRQIVEQRIQEDLLQAYTTKEGILNTAQMRRELLAELRRKKEETDG